MSGLPEIDYGHRTVAEQLGAANKVVPGYEALADVLERAYHQSARGKGAVRHAGPGEPFTAQVILQGAARFGVGALLFQAFKKSEESQRLKTGPGVNELLGAIVYLAAAVIERERLGALEPDGTEHVARP